MYSKLYLILVVLLVSVMLAACSDSTPTSPATAATEPATTAPTTAPATTTAAATTEPAKENYNPIIRFSAATLKVGDSLTITGSGYPANTKLNVALGVGDAWPTGTYAAPVTDAKGNFSTKIKLDKDAVGDPLQPGQVLVMVTASNSVGASAPVTLDGPVTAPPTTPAKTTVPATTTAPTTTTAPAKTTTTAGTPSKAGKWIDVNLSQQKLVAYEGNKAVFSTLVSSGTSRHPTVTGNFSIYLKYVKQDMRGGTGAEAYYLPNVPYVMYFYYDYGIHGTYWHNNFGHPMSHGCVNTPTDAAHWLYDWAPMGTLVSIHY